MDLVVVYIFFNLLEKYMVSFSVLPRKVCEIQVCQLLKWGYAYLHFRWIGVGVVVGVAGQELHVIPFLPLGKFVFFTSTDPSPNMHVKMGVEKKVRMVKTNTKQAAIEI